MKKTLALLLSLALITGFGALSAAAEGQTGVGTGNYTIDATGTYVEGTTGNGVVFCVDVEWTEMSFTYHAEQEPVWDTSTHTYSEAVDAYWEGDATITVTNHSNAKILVTPAYEAAEGYEAASVSFDTDALKLLSAEKTSSATSGTISVTPQGSLPAGTTEQKIGTITITIAEDTDITSEEAQELLEKIPTLQEQTYANRDTLDTEQSTLTVEETELRTTLDNYNSGTATQTELNEQYAATLRAYNALKEAAGL